MAATVVVLQGAGNAIAQFSPLPQSPLQGQNQAYTPNQGRYQNAPNQVYTPQQMVPQNQAFTQNLNQIYSQNPTYPQTPIQTQKQPQYTAMAFQPNGSQPNGGQAMAPMAAPAPMQTGGYAAQAGPGCNTCQPAAAPSYSSYDNAGCAPGGSGYNTFSNSPGYGGIGAGLGLGARRGCGRQWFGGFYGLYMERSGNPWRALAFSTLEANPAGYYPADNENVLNLTDLDNDTFSGAEIRFGATLGQGGACGCGPRYAWEVGYWGLLEDDRTTVVTDTAVDGNRLYGMLSHTGAFYNGRPVNDYFEYGPPVVNPAGDTIRIRQISARNSFSMQNLEVNLLRFPVLGGGYYGASAGGANGGGFGSGRGLGRRGGFGGYGAGSCDSGSCGVGGCDARSGGSCGVGGGCNSGFSATGLVGFRYVRIDEDFMFRSDFDNETTATTGFISRDVDVDNHLAGAQFGCNMIYRYGCSGRWAVHCNSVVGVFGNRSEVWNRMDAPVAGGDVTLQNGDNFDLRYEDNGIAVLGELRAGMSYQYSCNWRLFGGYRLIGISGVALAFDQISDQNISAAQASYVDSSGSIFIHGLQSGVEFTY
ncbi:MAG: BBP7 family outer membrane beta-barrel protein [Planctomycetes bacterium]|nr:BBP7 family outer membrane beta-barrel protein [Planctomycetota bacterium]